MAKVTFPKIILAWIYGTKQETKKFVDKIILDERLNTTSVVIDNDNSCCISTALQLSQQKLLPPRIIFIPTRTLPEENSIITEVTLKNVIILLGNDQNTKKDAKKTKMKIINGDNTQTAIIQLNALKK